MSKLTAEKCREIIHALKVCKSHFGIEESTEYQLQALEIALPVLAQQESEGLVERYESAFLCWEGDGIWFRVTDLVITESEFTAILADDGVKRSWPRCVYKFSESDPTGQSSTTPQIDNDGWIEWLGGDRPVGPDEMVELRLVGLTKAITRPAVAVEWQHGNGMGNIIAYRVIENDGREG